MLDVVKSAAHRRALAAAFDVEILSLATANPPFRLSQEEAAVYAKQLYPQLSKLWQLYDNTGIECRYNCEPIEWYLKPRSWQERTTAFRQHALDLLEEITIKTTERAGQRRRYDRDQYGHRTCHSKSRCTAAEQAQTGAND